VDGKVAQNIGKLSPLPDFVINLRYIAPFRIVGDSNVTGFVLFTPVKLRAKGAKCLIQPTNLLYTFSGGPFAVWEIRGHVKRRKTAAR